MYTALKRITGLYLLFVLLLITINGYSQVNKDSLLAVWNNETIADSTRLSALDKATWHGYLFKSPDSAFYYAQIQYDFASEIGNKKEMANALNTQGVSYSMRGQYSLALETLAKSLEIRIEIGDLYGISKSYTNMGPAYSNQGDNINALDVYEKSLAISEPNNFVRLISISLNNIGVIYKSQNDHAKAMEYFLQGLKLAREINNKRVEANTISNISTVYRDQGFLDSALVYAYNGLNIFEEIDDIKGIAAAYESIGVLYFRKKEYNKAITFDLKALKIREEIKDRLGLASSMVNLGLAHIQMGQPKQADSWCNKGLDMAISVGSLVYKKSACECLYEVNEAKGDYRKSLEYYIQFKQYDDSLKSGETTKKLQQMEFAKQTVRDSIAYEIKIEESKIAYADKIHRRNSLQYSGIAIALFILISWWFFARNLNLPEWVIELSLFVPFLVFFRFITILLAPFTGNITNDEPFYQLLLSLVLAALITPTHRFFERKVRKKIFVKKQSDSIA